MALNRWKQSKTSVYNLNYHIVFCPKYRRKVLVDGIDERLKGLIRQKCNEMDIEIKSLEVMPDHVHLFVSVKPIHSPQFIVSQIKGMSSRVLRKEYPQLKRKLPSLWTRSYYIESVGHISENTIKKYINEQKQRHSSHD